jgi:hypothetical protein
MIAPKINYLNNRDMLSEIHKSKISYCEYSDPRHADYDLILESADQIFLPETLKEAKIKREAKLADIAHKAAIALKPAVRPKLAEFSTDPELIADEDIVFRVTTYEHIPLELGRKKNPKTEADTKSRLNFIPFKHYMLEYEVDSTGQRVPKLKEVLVSHSKNGEFSVTHGSITDKLARMIMLLVTKYSQRSNWRGYTYLDEMRGHAILQLAQMCLQFNEAKSDNPFAYFTSSISNSFTRVLNTEKKNQDIRDDLLQTAGQMPSYTRQLAIEEEIRQMRGVADESSE